MSCEFRKIYLDKEKDIIVNLFEPHDDEMEYILETPNHSTGNLITNLAKLCNLNIDLNEVGNKIIRGTIPASINGDNEEVYILRLGGIKIANIYQDRIEVKAKIPAITKTLMSQTKDYKLDIKKTIVKSYITKKLKFRTDLHTHIHANLTSDALIALGIKHQIAYPFYYVKKLGLKLSDNQIKDVFLQKIELEKKYAHLNLNGKNLIRKIDDEIVINFADLILNNLKYQEQNIAKIRNSLVLMKDGQAVFTNLEKLYLYRYVFSKGVSSKNKIKITNKKIDCILESDIKIILKQLMEDSKKLEYKNNSLLQDKLLLVAREYQKQGIYYAEIAVSWIVRKGIEGAKILEELHDILPKIEKETNVKLRFLAAISRTLMSPRQLVEAVDVIKAMAKSPYVVGSDIMGEEINDIREFSPIIKELVRFAIKQNNGFTIRIHAGENDSYKENVLRAVECVIESVPKNKLAPKCRIGHGLYGMSLKDEDKKTLIEKLKQINAVLEFQLTSNFRLNNLNKIENHPIKYYLENGIKCVQGTDGCGIYGTDCMEEEMALTNLLNVTDEQMYFMRQTENEIFEDSCKYFYQKQEKFAQFLKGRNVADAILEDENIILNRRTNSLLLEKRLQKKTNLEACLELKEKIVDFPLDKVPIIIAGGSFNSNGRITDTSYEEVKILEELVRRIKIDKAYFVIGHSVQGYERELINITQRLNKKFEINAIIPNQVSEKIKNSLLDINIHGIRISTEGEESGIYKSFNYEIFERRDSIVLAFDGNSPVSNLVQEAKNGKGNSKIFVNTNVKALEEKAKSLEGYVESFSKKQNIIDEILKEYPELEDLD